MAPETRRPHHHSELTSCYHDAFPPWGHYHNNIVLFYHDSTITRSHFMDPTDCAIKGFYCIIKLILSIFLFHSLPTSSNLTWSWDGVRSRPSRNRTRLSSWGFCMSFSSSRSRSWHWESCNRNTTVSHSHSIGKAYTFYQWYSQFSASLNMAQNFHKTWGNCHRLARISIKFISMVESMCVPNMYVVYEIFWAIEC